MRWLRRVRNIVIYSHLFPFRLTMSQPYVLPNRKAFADYITRVFLKYRGNKDKPGNRELFPYQKIIRDYLLIETPYRGLLVYHGLGSGKTCSSIAVAESLLSDANVFVMLPASLEENYLGEIRKCGDPIYAYDQHWTMKQLTEQTRAEAKALKISDGFLALNQKFYVTSIGKEPNFNNLPETEKEVIRKQIEDIIHQRFSFIRYNGLSRKNIDKYLAKEGEPNPYDNAVIIVDEIHNFISRIVNKSDIANKLYEEIHRAKGCKIVALSGTPIINRPNEISYLMNFLRGPIERVNIPFATPPTWDEEKITNVLRTIPDIDTIEFNVVKKYVMVTRNPPKFRSVYNEKGDRIAVQYMKDLNYNPNANEWVGTWKDKFEGEVGGAQIAMERISVDTLEALPTDFEEFVNTFLDGLTIKNPFLFKRRIQGLVSYYKGADESVLPRRIDDDKMLELIPMSKEQFSRYLEVRWKEIQQDSKNRISMNDDLKTFRVKSRLVCNYAVPPDIKEVIPDENLTEDNISPNERALGIMRNNPKKYLSKEALAIFSPKMLKMLNNVEETLGGEKRRNQFIYSQYRSLEGLGVFSAILDANGWQEYKITKMNGQWVEDPSLDQEKPAYAFYTGEEDVEQREYIRQIFNESYADNFPSSLKLSLQGKTRKLCIMMASSSGAEGITLLNVRHVHIMEPHWTPTRHDQVIGRAIRINSHASLPPEERTVRVSFYLSVFNKEEAKSVDYPNIVPIRRSDTVLKRYTGGNPEEVFMSTDEALYETSYEKDVVGKRISVLLKEAAIDCEIHRKLHGTEKPVLSCMRFDTTTTGEDLAFKPSINSENRDLSYLRNMTKRERILQKVAIHDMVFYIDPSTSEVFDGPAFEDNKRLMRVGLLTSPTQIKFILV